MQITDAMVAAARKIIWGRDHNHLHGDDLISAALTAALAEMWRPIEELTTEQNENRILVAGWQKPTAKVAGYWWWHEDNVVDGRPFDHPEAQFWCLAHFALPAPPMGRE